MFARQISRSSHTRTLTVSLAVTNEEINGVLVAVVAVGYSVLTVKVLRVMAQTMAQKPTPQHQSSRFGHKNGRRAWI
jgi:hypothetical protein